MIYLVEDDDSIRELVLYTLHTTGFEAEGFRNAADFWQALEKELPQLVLLVPADRTLHENWLDQPDWKPNAQGIVTNSDFFGGDLKGIEETATFIMD